MRVVHRDGDGQADRMAGAEPDAGVATSNDDRDDPGAAETELEIRASEMTAVAVAAAAVTSAVATAEASPFAKPSSLPSHAPASAESPDQPLVPTPASTSVSSPEFVQYQRESSSDKRLVRANTATASLRSGKLLMSWISWGLVGAILWWSGQWQWPERSLDPVVTAMPTLSKPAAVSTAPASAVVENLSENQPPDVDNIALLQQQAEEKAHALAQKRAAADARRQQEDAVQALREKRRQAAEAELAAARANAERLQPVVPATTSAIIEVPAEPALAEQVRQCQAQPLMARDTCLRSLCNGRWGKQGCPAYDSTYDGA